MKKRKQTNEESTNDAPYDPKQKKYIILTLKGQYEKTHYPLPLVFLAEPDINTLRRTFTRM
jgi:hypothetical protein